MLILIAESKTMTPCAGKISPADRASRSPRFDATADSIMAALRGKTADALAAKIGISPALARSMSRMIYEFPNKALGESAVLAYTGVVFKALDYGSLSAAARSRAAKSLKIVSSLYGWLSADDVIKPYRCDFSSKIAPGGLALNRFWRDNVTDALLDDLRTGEHAEVLDLLPGDAAKCIDWKRVAPVAKVYKADFAEIHDGGASKTPNAGKLKTLRGKLLRHILSAGIGEADSLRGIDCGDFAYDSEPSPGHLLFITA